MSKLLNSFFISFLFFLTTIIFLDVNFLAANFIMSLICFLIVNNAYDRNSSFFALNNLFVFIFFILGVLLRYLVLSNNFEDAMHFATFPLNNDPSYQLITSFCLLIAIILFIFGKAVYRKTHIISGSKKIELIQAGKFLGILRILQTLGFFLLIFIFSYKLNNLRFAVDGSFGVYDNIVNIFFTIVKYIACISFISFLMLKDKISLLFSAICYMPEVIFSVIMAWKGPILIIVFSLFIALDIVRRRFNQFEIKKILLIFSIFFLVYPVISMYRVNLQLERPYYEYNFDSIIEYNVENNIFRYISNRFSYYDEIYYVINCNDEKKEVFLDNTGLIHERFIDGVVPRIFNEDKKVVNIGSDITHYLMDKPPWFYNNITITYIGDAWISYGFLGVGFINFIIGYFINSLEREKTKNIFSASKYIMISSLLFGFMEGDIAGKYIMFLLTIFSIMLINTVFSIFGYKVGGENVQNKTC